MCVQAHPSHRFLFTVTKAAASLLWRVAAQLLHNLAVLPQETHLRLVTPAKRLQQPRYIRRRRVPLSLDQRRTSPAQVVFQLQQGCLQGGKRTHSERRVGDS